MREAARLSDLADRAAIARDRAPAPTKAKSSPRCIARFSPAAATIPATNSSSVRATTRCCAATRAAAARSTPTTSSRSNSPASIRHYHAAIMRTHRRRARRSPRTALSRGGARGARACEAELRPGRTAGDVFAAHAARPRRPWPVAPPAQRLRLCARREVHALVDGPADVLRGQRIRDRPFAGLFPAHDPDGQRQPDRDVPRANLSRRRRRGRADQRRAIWTSSSNSVSSSGRTGEA